MDQEESASIERARQLVRQTVRCFYGPESIAVCDAVLAGEKAVRDEDIAALLSIPVKFASKTLQFLAKERILHSHSKEEAMRRGSGKTAATFYYCAYGDFVTALRWRLHRLKVAAAQVAAASDAAFKCLSCNILFGALQVDKLISMMDGELHCTECDRIVVSCVADQEKERQIAMWRELNALLKPLHDGVRKLESVTLPHVEWPFQLRRLKDDGLDEEQRRAKQEAEAYLLDGIPSISVEVLPSDDMVDHRNRFAMRTTDPATSRAMPSWVTKGTASQRTTTESSAAAAAVDTVDAEEFRLLGRKPVPLPDSLTENEHFMIKSARDWLEDAQLWLRTNNIELADLKNGEPPHKRAKGVKQSSLDRKHTMRLDFLRNAVDYDTLVSERRQRFVNEFLRQRLFVRGGLWEVRSTDTLTPKQAEWLAELQSNEARDAAWRNTPLLNRAALAEGLPPEDEMSDEQYKEFGRRLFDALRDLVA